ncbi:MAG: hypothetical protein LC795_04700 [Acidobacteria bacterium]|nr:hypothetical protein [Acidobacteriota bacterium]MCA1618608.1 hypothetical protein [Acidobacteriota bacterium]
MNETSTFAELTIPETTRVVNRNNDGGARTPGRKLVKDDISTTSALIRGCTTQCCCEPPNLDGSV